jgi:signal transduction histidine kinase
MVLLTLFAVRRTMTKIVVRPVEELTVHVNKLNTLAGAASQEDTSKSFDEMRHLGFIFNDMAEKLQSAYVDMERKVEERTQLLWETSERLSEKSEELQGINVLLLENKRKKMEFMTVLSDELSQPLREIIVFSQNMLEKQSGAWRSRNQDQKRNQSLIQNKYLLRNQYHDKNQKTELANILWQAQNLDNQISNLVAMSEIEAGLMALDYTELYIEEILKELKGSMAPMFVRKGLKFSVDIAPSTPSVVADPAKLTHVLRNLLSDSVHYTPDGGWIKIMIEPLPVSRYNKKMILIQVSDNGSSVRDEDIPGMLTKTLQGKRVGKESRGGLGLAIVKIFVEMHGGTVEVKSIWNKGTFFSIRIPRSPD